MAWGGVDVQWQPPPSAEPGTPADAPPPEEPPPPEVPQPLLLAGTVEDDRATLVVVGELGDPSVVPATQTSMASGAIEGSQWVLFAEGVRVGRMTADQVGPAEGFCPSTPALSGVVELVPTAGDLERVIALPAAEAESRPFGEARPLAHDYDQRVASLTFAQDAVRRIGADWPDGGVLPTRQDIVSFQPAGTAAPTIAGSYVYRDQLGVRDPASGAYSLFVLSARVGGQFRETFEWFQAADSTGGKRAPQYFGHLDVDGDGEGEILLDVFGSERRWHAVLEQQDADWVRAFESPCAGS